MNWTEKDLADWERSHRAPTEPKPALKNKAKRSPRQMNKLESTFAGELHSRLLAGDILYYQYEGVRFRLADSTYYKPDFIVLSKSGEMVLYETKGHWREAARVRIKVAADRFPYLFVAVTKVRGAWQEETFGDAWQRLRSGRRV